LKINNDWNMLKSKDTRKMVGRRDFIKIAGLSAAASALAACSTDNKESAAKKDSRKTRGEMTYRINPNTKDRVSILGYGCMRLPTIPTDPDMTVDQEAINRSVDEAIKGGVNYFDTSPAYCKGQSEKAMGIALSRYPRESYYIATKLSNFSPSTWSREESLKMFNNSFKYLQTDYIDYLLLHGIGMGGMEAFNGRYIDNGILNYLVKQRENGRIRNLGFSYHGDVEVFDHLLKMQDDGDIHWDFVQIQLNYIDWLHAKEVNVRNTNAEYLYNELHKRGIPVVIMEPLLGGRLATTTNHITSLMKQRRPDDSVASWAFRYAGSPEGVLTVLSGMTYIEHLEDNLNTYSPLEPVTEEEKAFLGDIANLMLEFPTVPCTDCKYCMPCPYGVNIPGIFAHYNACVNDGNITSGKESDDYTRARKAFLVGYDRKVPRLRQASHCIGCHTCEPHCPQGIHIPDQLHAIDNYAEKLRRNA